jgi:hypothetical protein
MVLMLAASFRLQAASLLENQLSVIVWKILFGKDSCKIKA